ncbi:MAG: type II toxin-antitoxin system RelE/ParE family toxin [Anaerolineaceae bacterium]
MKKIQISFTNRFQKHSADLSENEKKQLKNKLELLSNNPLHPSLRVKRIQGTEELFEFSVNMDIRVIWYLETDELIILVDIGHHDLLKRY